MRAADGAAVDVVRGGEGIGEAGGAVTPPYGLLLFMMEKIANVPLRDLVREVMPFLAVMIGALALITLVPDLVLFLPRLMGYKG